MIATFLAWGLVYVVFGMVCFILDKRYGSRIYVKIKKKGSDPKETIEEKGIFVYGRKQKSQWVFAVIASAALTAIIGEGADFLTKIFLGLTEAGFMVAGFWLGPVVYRSRDKVDKGFETLDKIKKGEIDVGGEIKEKVSETTGRIKDAVTSEAKDIKDRVIEGITETTHGAIEKGKDMIPDVHLGKKKEVKQKKKNMSENQEPEEKVKKPDLAELMEEYDESLKKIRR